MTSSTQVQFAVAQARSAASRTDSLPPFARFANAIAHWSGKPVAFVLCCLAILIWVLTGPLFHYSDTWQLVINTGTTIVTFLMVFLIQNTQNRDGTALQAKLDELILATKEAQNAFIAIEKRPDEELEKLRSEITKAAQSTGN